MIKLFFLSVFLSFGQWCFCQQQTVDYTELDSFILNPSRGFCTYTLTKASTPYPLDSTWLDGLRYSDSISIIFRYVYLDTFLNSPISASYLNSIEQDFETIRNTGFKVILRFAYTNYLPPNAPYNDSPSKVQLLDHIEQLRPILQDNADVILTLQSGFWGVWGENFFSDVFGTDFGASVVTPAQWADRKEITDSLLSIMPPSTLVSLRYPVLKANYLSLNMPQDTITVATAHDGTDRSRLGFHNDCFLVDANDYTFGNIVPEKTYWENESRYTAMGGESCGDNATYTNCVNALTDLENAHWTYANNYYHPDVMARWRQEGCYDEIRDRLGYRFVLDSGNYDTVVVVGSNLNFDLSLYNVGFASTVEEKMVNLVLQNADTSLAFTLNTDTRYWFGGRSTLIQESIPIPSSTPIGVYDAFLQVLDVNPGLQSNPFYAIRMANVNTWDGSSGLNNLNVSVEIRDNSVGIEEEMGVTQYRVYPNPSDDGFFFVQGIQLGDEVRGEVFDLSGKRILELNLTESESEVDLSRLERGVYFMKIGGEFMQLMKQ